jgi:hypothetical protein
MLSLSYVLYRRTPIVRDKKEKESELDLVRGALAKADEKQRELEKSRARIVERERTAIRELSERERTAIRELSERARVAIRELRERETVAMQELSDREKLAIGELSERERVARRELSERSERVEVTVQEELRAISTGCKARLSTINEQLKALQLGEINSLAQALTGIQEKHLTDRLNHAKIAHSGVPGIGPVLLRTLGHVGISTAADFTGISYDDSGRVYFLRRDGHWVHPEGVGETKAETLEVWRRDLEAKARLTQPTGLSVTETQAIKGRYAQQRQSLSAQMERIRGEGRLQELQWRQKAERAAKLRASEAERVAKLRASEAKRASNLRVTEAQRAATSLSTEVEASATSLSTEVERVANSLATELVGTRGALRREWSDAGEMLRSVRREAQTVSLKRARLEKDLRRYATTITYGAYCKSFLRRPRRDYTARHRAGQGERHVR